jgi:hypothetical protein
MGDWILEAVVRSNVTRFDHSLLFCNHVSAFDIIASFGAKVRIYAMQTRLLVGAPEGNAGILSVIGIIFKSHSLCI